VGDLDFGLSSKGDAVFLLSKSGEIHDFVEYESELPWPVDAKGTGATLELTDPDLDNALPGSWIASTGKGTPSLKNSNFVGIDHPSVKEAISSSARLYPSIFHDMTNIEFELASDEHVHISVISMSGRAIEVLANQKLPSGQHLYNWIPAQSGAEPGMYIIRIETSETIHTLKAIYQ